jgi:hypothetical protein
MCHGGEELPELVMRKGRAPFTPVVSIGSNKGRRTREMPEGPENKCVLILA